MKLKLSCILLLVMLFMSSQAWAVMIGGKNIGTIPDILKAARGGGIVNKVDSDLELGKNSILRLHDDGQLDLHYEIGNGDKDLSLGKINGYSTTTEMRDNGLLAALAKPPERLTGISSIPLLTVIPTGSTIFISRY